MFKRLILAVSLACGALSLQAPVASAGPIHASGIVNEAVRSPVQLAQYYYGPRRRYVPRRYYAPPRYYGRRYYGRPYYAPRRVYPAPRYYRPYPYRRPVYYYGY